MFDGKFLRVVRSIEVFPVKAALGSSHVPTDDEVGTPIVFTEHHVLNCFSGASHMHRIWEVRPLHVRIVDLGFQDFVSLVTHITWNVVSLRGAACRVHQNNTAIAVFVDIWSIQCAHEKFKVSSVNRVAALKSNNVGVGWQALPDLKWGLAQEIAGRKLDTSDTTPDVFVLPLHRHHLYTWVLQGGRTIAQLCLLRFVGNPTIVYFHDSHRLALPQQTNLLSWPDVIPSLADIHYNGQTEK
mmetsp:Transcript_7227/g.11037  ORF Transcript_7227/g.11037 Transcript_7227/m.11037 type:complete len:241 (+) Transcript_7227:392-1114(+)